MHAAAELLARVDKQPFCMRLELDSYIMQNVCMPQACTHTP